jgi:hypothetical protein
MLRLALPTIVVLVVQTLVGVAETYFVSFLGTEALAGVALVFPVLMLVQMMSNAGIGGVAAAVARAVGADRGGSPIRTLCSLAPCRFGLSRCCHRLCAAPGTSRRPRPSPWLVLSFWSRCRRL